MLDQLILAANLLLSEEKLSTPPIYFAPDEAMSHPDNLGETYCIVSPYSKVCVIKLHECLSERTASEELLREVVYHELAHYVVLMNNHKEKPHGKAWRDQVLKWGVTPREYVNPSKMNQECRREFL